MAPIGGRPPAPRQMPLTPIRSEPTHRRHRFQPQRPRIGQPHTSVVVKLSSRTGAASATMNRRIAAVRGLFEYAVVAGVCAQNPVPAARRSTGVRAQRRGLLGHLGPGRSGRGAGRLVRAPKRLPEALEAREVAEFVADLSTARDRAMALLMLLGGLRAMEVRGLLLADVDLGLRRVRVLGKGGKERTVPVDPEFFTELAIYLRRERPPGCGNPGMFRRVARAGDDRGRDAQNLPDPLRPGGDTAGAPAPAAPHLRNSVGFGGNGFARPSGADGARVAGNDRQSACTTPPSAAPGKLPARSTSPAAQSPSTPTDRSPTEPGPNNAWPAPPKPCPTATAGCRCSAAARTPMPV